MVRERYSKGSFDRKGRVIAENLPAYQLELVPEQVDDLDDTLNRLGETREANITRWALSCIRGEKDPLVGFENYLDSLTRDT